MLATGFSLKNILVWASSHETVLGGENYYQKCWNINQRIFISLNGKIHSISVGRVWLKKHWNLFFYRHAKVPFKYWFYLLQALKSIWHLKANNMWNGNVKCKDDVKRAKEVNGKRNKTHLENISYSLLRCLSRCHITSWVGKSRIF